MQQRALDLLGVSLTRLSIQAIAHSKVGVVRSTTPTLTSVKNLSIESVLSK
ncbi:hypothetical protein [Brasilonema sp. UFV-L1]|uniref:hypothetical protein n=1 Tax=Brasilonema sp. UFV-L1 TaxID=2234130 RepID=UPI001B7D1A88|nr:hypothetical protein [Brasilonema sp. UFV-L1]